MFMKSMFEAEAISDKPKQPKQPPQQWMIVRTHKDGTKWALWRSHDNGVVTWIKVEELGNRYKPRRYKTISGAKRQSAILMRETATDATYTYAVKEWVE